jgi:hypothetical protein
MPKSKRSPKDTALEEAGEAQKIVLSMPAGWRSAPTERGSSKSGVGTQAQDTTLPGTKARKARRIETKGSDRVASPAPREQQEAPSETPRAKRGPSVSTMAIVACFGGLLGSMATIGAAKYLPVALVPSAIVNGELVHRLAHIDSELDALKASIATSTDEARGQEQSSSAEQPAKGADDMAGPMPDARSAQVSPASLAADSVVDGWILRNVSGGSALVEGRPGLIQVMPGDSLPGVGRVETIKREDGRWVVVTTGGLIVSR